MLKDQANLLRFTTQGIHQQAPSHAGNTFATNVRTQDAPEYTSKDCHSTTIMAAANSTVCRSVLEATLARSITTMPAAEMHGSSLTIGK